MLSDIYIRPASLQDIPNLIVSLCRLLTQLSPSATCPSESHLSEIISSPNSILYIACSQEYIIGILTLIIYKIPTSIRAYIEDVVVDESWRQRGIGESLLKEAMKEAKIRGANSVNLTSRPSRGEANKLYKKIGFDLVETNVYRYNI
jgi:ribosomal protein S18 acetylase RimI-like enzyme